MVSERSWSVVDLKGKERRNFSARFGQQPEIPKGSAVILLGGQITCGGSIFLSEGQKNSIFQDQVILKAKEATQIFRWANL